jgi:hypothetical protein
MSAQIIPLKDRTDLRESSRILAHAASPIRHELAAISFVQKMIRRRQSQQHH